MNNKNKTKTNFIPGNYEDKYNTKNPIARLLVSNFIKRYKDGLKYIKNKLKIKKFADLGCAEGFLLREGICILGSDIEVFACDISPQEISKAKKKLKDYKIKFSIQDIENLKEYKSNYFDLITCCEVLEHVFHPEKAISEIYRILKKGGYALLSVPNEPIWRILNVLRGKYIKDLGNTPGHVNHWSARAFKKFLEKSELKVVKDISPFPWTMVVVKKA